MQVKKIHVENHLDGIIVLDKLLTQWLFFHDIMNYTSTVTCYGIVANASRSENGRGLNSCQATPLVTQWFQMTKSSRKQVYPECFHEFFHASFCKLT